MKNLLKGIGIFLLIAGCILFLFLSIYAFEIYAFEGEIQSALYKTVISIPLSILIIVPVLRVICRGAGHKNANFWTIVSLIRWVRTNSFEI